MKVKYKSLHFLTGLCLLANTATGQATHVTEFKDSQILNSYPISVAFDKTTHIIFPASIKYVDLGNDGIIADKAEGVENILRIKANFKGFQQTSLSVVTGDGKYYSFLVDYSEQPNKLNISIIGADFSGTTRKVAISDDDGESIVSFEEVKMSETKISRLAFEISKSKRIIKHIGLVKDDMLFLLYGLFIKDNVIFFRTHIKNKSNINYDIDFVKFYIRDKEIIKRTAIQELEITPLYVYSSSDNNDTILGKSSIDKVFTLQKFTIPDNKILEVEMFEKGGGRHLKFQLNNLDIVNAKLIK